MQTLTCCRNSLSGKTAFSQTTAQPSSWWFGDADRVAWNITRVSFRKFLPIINSSRPPIAEHDVSDFLQISGTPGGCAVQRKTTNKIMAHTHTQKIEYLLQIICCEHTCNVSTVPSSFVNCVRNTIRQRVDFFLLRGPDWSGNRCSTSTFRSFSMPTQSHVADISFSGFNSISMTIVPSSFFSMHCVEFLPDTLHA